MSIIGKKNNKKIEDDKTSFSINLRRGNVTNLIPKALLGFNNDIEAVETSIIDGFSSGETITMTSTSKDLSISSTSTEDNFSGTGGFLVIIGLLNGDRRRISKILQLNGQTQVSITGAADIITVQSIAVIGLGTGAPTDASGENIGDLWIGLTGDTLTGGKPDNDLYGCCAAGKNASAMAIQICGSTELLRSNSLTILSSLNGNDTGEILFYSMSLSGNITYKVNFPISVGTAPDIDISNLPQGSEGCIVWTNAIRTNGNNSISITAILNAFLDSSGERFVDAPIIF